MARHLVQTCIALGITCAVVAEASPSALATPGWLSPIEVAEGSHNADDSADVAMDARGDTLLVWVQHNGENSLIEAAWRPAGGAFSTPTTLSPLGASVSSPVVAMDPEGDATVAWISAFSVEITGRSASGLFTTPATAFPFDNFVFNPVVAMDSKGDATVAWTWNNGGFDTTEVTSQSAGGTFSSPTAVSSFSFGSATTPAIAMDPQGDATVAWSQNEPIKKISLIQMATQLASTDFGPETGFSLSASYPTVAMDSHGDTTVVWAGYDAEHTANTIEASTRTALTREFETPAILSSTPSSGEETSKIQPKVAMDAMGDTTVGWASTGGIKIDKRPAGGSFSKPIELLSNPLVTESFPIVAMDDRGDGTVVWAQTGIDEGSSFLLASTESAGGTFGSPAFISQGSGLLTPEDLSPPISLAMDSHGDAVTVWMSSGSERDGVQVAGYQAGGPQLESLQTPAEGQAGAGLTFSVFPLSVWSTVASTTWSWDDGSPDTSGTSATHVFNAPGTYHVSVSATDALGNITNATRTITIQAPPAIPINPKPTPTPPRPKPKAPKAIVSAFTPLFATKAAIGGSALGLFVGIAAVRGARAGDTIVVRCTAGCQRPLHEVVHVRKHHNTRGTITISPPLLVSRTTIIEVELLAPGHVARFVQYHFIRTRNTLIAHPTRRGCLSPTGRPRNCP